MLTLVLYGNSTLGNPHDLCKHTSENIIIEGKPTPRYFKEEFEEGGFCFQSFVCLFLSCFPLFNDQGLLRFNSLLLSITFCDQLEVWIIGNLPSKRLIGKDPTEVLDLVQDTCSRSLLPLPPHTQEVPDGFSQKRP